eukprot:5524978-Prymnesium_polylepis.1
MAKRLADRYRSNRFNWLSNKYSTNERGACESEPGTEARQSERRERAGPSSRRCSSANVRFYIIGERT